MRPAVVLAATAAGFAALALLTYVVPGAALPVAATALATATLVVWAASFVCLFFAWACLGWRQAFADGMETVVVTQIAGVIVSFLMTMNVFAGADYLAVLNVFGVLPIGAAYCVVQRLRHSDAVSSHSGPEPDGTRSGSPALTLWLVMLGAAFFATGMLGYTHYFDDDYSGLGALDVWIDVLTLLTLAAMAGFSVYAARNVPAGRDVALGLVLVTVLGAFAAFFVVLVAVAVPGELLYGLARLIRRLSRVVTFVTVLVIAYQHDLDPVAPFGLAFLVPSLLPKAVQTVVSSADSSLLVASTGQDYALVALVTTGFFLTACLVAFCLLNIDGRLARGLLVSEPSPTGLDGEGAAGDEAARRARACGELMAEFDLTRRESDVLGLFSRGVSAQQAALSLCISVNTVNTHAMTLYRKLGVHSKQELAELVEARA